jgi:hypothetical protein
VHEVLKTVIIYLQAFDGKLALKGVRIKLSHLVMIDVEFLQLLQVLQAIDLDYFVSGGLEDLQLRQLAEVQAVEVLEHVVREVENLQVLAAIKSLEDGHVGVKVQSLDLVGLQDENFECGQVAEHLYRAELVAS